MKHRKQVATAALASAILVTAAFVAVPSWAQSDEKAAICAEADARYKDLYGDKPLPANTVVVKTYKYTFCPPKLTVKAGTTVRWVNVDKRTSHSVWLKESGVAESDRFFPEEQWEFTFRTPGEYPYLCGPHWEQEKMTGTVTVTP